MDDAIRGSLFFNLAGLGGSLAGSWFIARRGSRTTLLLACFAAIAGTSIVGSQLVGNLDYRIAVAGAMLAGVGSGIVQVTLFAVAAFAYPPDRRARGIGWGSSVGRVGAILSAGTGGIALQQAYGGPTFVAAILAAAAIAIAGVLIADRHIPGKAAS